MERIKFILVFVYIIISTLHLYSQNNDIRLPDLIPPSPETVSLFKYIEHSPDLATGSVNINIPIYEISCSSLNIPISISYHSSGRKVSDLSGAVGLGWSLNTGSSISRTINGLPDEVASHPPYHMSASELKKMQYTDHHIYYEKLRERTKKIYVDYDTEYDIYSYAIPGHSGHFIYDAGNTLKGKITTTQNKIIPLSLNPIKFLELTQIIDEKGNKYTFGAEEFAKTSLGSSHPTTWCIKNIKSINGKDSVDFEYTSVSKKYPKSSTTLTITDYNTWNRFTGSVLPSDIPEYKTESGYEEYVVPRLTKIKWLSGELEITYDSTNKINLIKIKDAHGNVIKQMNFIYTIIDFCKENNYVLTSIEWQDKNARTIESHKFEYYPSSNFRLNNRDYWGYRNKASDMIAGQYGIPPITINVNGTHNKTYGLGNFEPNLQYAKCGVLKKVIYPTGGYTEFEYESNKYKENNAVSPVKQGKGIRLSKIKTTDIDSNQTITKTYKYGLDECGYTQIYISPDEWKYNATEYETLQTTGTSGYIHVLGARRTRVYNVDLIGDMQFFSNLPLMYNKVTEYINDEQKIEHNFSDKYMNTRYSQFSKPSGLPTELVFEPYFEMEAERDYRSYVRDHTYSMQSKSYGSFYDCFWRNNNLISKIEYKKDNDDFKIVKKTIYKYQSERIDTVKSIKIMKYINFSNDIGQQIESRFAMRSNLLSDMFVFSDYYITIGKDKLKETSEIIYDNDENISLTKIENYTYNNKGLIDKSIIYNSSGDTQINEIKYPFEYNNILCNDMTALNMLNYPIQKNLYKGSQLLDRIDFEYKDKGNKDYKIDKVYHSNKNILERELRIQYHYYDSHGNPLYITKDNCEKVIYLWGYSGQYPIAEIKNATYDQIKTILGETLINRVSDAIVPSTADMQAINNLRKSTALKDVHITTYTYKPLLGIQTVTDPSGLTTTYEYDDSNRLKTIKDPEGKTIESYQYHYKN